MNGSETQGLGQTPQGARVAMPYPCPRGTHWAQWPGGPAGCYSMQTAAYIVQHGDTPARIAQKLTGNPARMSELVSANPQLPRVVSSGWTTFQSLHVGQKLAVPASWVRFGGGVVTTQPRRPTGYPTAPEPGEPTVPGGQPHTPITPEPRNPTPTPVVPYPEPEPEPEGPVSFWSGGYLGQAATNEPGSRAPRPIISQGPHMQMPPGYNPRIAAEEPAPWTGRGHTYPHVPGMNVAPIGGNPTRYRGLGDAGSIQIEIESLTAATNIAVAADPDGSYSGCVKDYQQAGQIAVQSLGPDLDNTYGINLTGPYTQAAFQQNGQLAAINNGPTGSGNAATQADANNALSILSQMQTQYTQAYYAGQASVSPSPPPGGGGGGGGGGTYNPSAGTTAADQLYQYLTTSGCDCSANLQAATKTFQQSAKLTADGYYGTNTYKALQTALNNEWKTSGSTGAPDPAPPPCYTTDKTGKQTGACSPAAPVAPPKPVTPPTSPCATGQVQDTGNGQCVPNTTCPGGAAPNNGLCPGQPVVNPPAPVQASANGLIAGVILVGLGAGAVAYAVGKKKHRVHHRHPARRR